MSFGSAPFGSAAFGATGMGDADLFSSATILSPAEAFRRRLGQFFSSAAGTNAITANLGVSLLSDADVADVSIADVLANLVATLNAQASGSASGTFARNLSSAASFTDLIGVSWAMLVEGEADAADTAEGTVYKLVAIAESLAAMGITDGRLTAYAAVATAAAVDANANVGFAVTAESQAAIAGDAHGFMLAMLNLAETLQATDAAQGSLLLTLLADSSAAIVDTPAAALTALADLEGGAAIYVSLRLGSTDYHGWVFNTDLKAVTEYRNVQFDSFATFQGVTYGAGQGGIVALLGDTDDGAAIDAWFTPFLTDFGAQKFKRVSDVWVGADIGGKLWVKTLTRDPVTGAKLADFYAVVAKQGDGVQPGRVEVGRGLKSTFWGLTVQNFDPDHPELSGGDFDIDSIQWRYLAQDRRQ